MGSFGKGHCRTFSTNFRKILLVSVKFVSAILGPEMAAPILWTPGKKSVLSAGKPVSVNSSFLGGGGVGGGGVPILFLMGARIFLKISRTFRRSSAHFPDTIYRRGIGVRVKGVAGRDAILAQ